LYEYKQNRVPRGPKNHAFIHKLADAQEKSQRLE